MEEKLAMAKRGVFVDLPAPSGSYFPSCLGFMSILTRPVDVSLSVVVECIPFHFCHLFLHIVKSNYQPVYVFASAFVECNPFNFCHLDPSKFMSSISPYCELKLSIL